MLEFIIQTLIYRIMKHLKTYDNFNKLNEELDPAIKRSLMILPQVLVGALATKLLGAYPLLNVKWREMKRATIGLKDSPLSTGSQIVVKHDLHKIDINQLPKNSLKISMLFRDWNIYLAKDYKSKGGGEHGQIERQVIYISKDDIKIGDTCRGERLNDSDIYKDDDFIMRKNSKGRLIRSKLKDPENFPMIIMLAKYDLAEKVKDIEQNISDICLELGDEFSTNVKPHFYIETDYLNFNIDLNYRDTYYSHELNNTIKEVCERIKDYLLTEKYDFNYVIKYTVKDSLFYRGNAGRFGTEIIPAAKDHVDRSESEVWSERYNTLNIKTLNNLSYLKKDKLTIFDSDMDLLLSDIDNCSRSIEIDIKSILNSLSDIESGKTENKTLSNNKKLKDHLIDILNRNKVDKIKLKSVFVEFKKK